MAEGWICISKKILEWEWYSDPNVVRLFLHLLLKANFCDAKWQGHTVKRGQVIASRGRLSEQLGLTVKQIRGAEAKLSTSEAVVVEGANKFTLYTILKYEEYQGEQQERASRGQPKGKEKTNKGQHYNKDNKDNKDTVLYAAVLLPDWLPLPEWGAFKKMRAESKSSMTEEAEALAIATLDKLRTEGHDPQAVLEQSIMRGWKGLFPIKSSTQQKGSHHGKHSRFEKQDYYAGTEGFTLA